MIERFTSKLTKTIELKAGKVFTTVMQDVKDDLVRSPIVERLEVSSTDATKQAIKAKRTRFIEDLCEKLDIEALEKHVNMDNAGERLQYKLAIKNKIKKDTGVKLRCEDKGVGVLKQASKILTEQLILYKKLGMSIPDEIKIKDLGYNEDKNSIIAEMLPNFFDKKQPTTTIILDKNIFQEEFKNEHKTVLENVLEIFNHEQTHSRHVKENTEAYKQLKSNGLNVILTKDEQNTMQALEYRYYKHFKELNKHKLFNNIDNLNTNLQHDNDNSLHRAGGYNMKRIGNLIRKLARCINYDSKNPESEQTLSKKLLEDFSPEFLKSLEPIQKKFETITYTISKENLTPYAFCNPLETVAMAAEKEYAGEALSDDMRNLLKEFGAPETKHMSYLPYNHPVMIKMRETQNVTPKQKGSN